MKKNTVLSTWLLLVAVMISGSVQAQIKPTTLTWKINVKVQANKEISAKQILTPYFCNECNDIVKELYNIPVYTTYVDASNIDISSIRLKNIKTEKANSNGMLALLASEFEITTRVVYERKRRLIELNVIPIRKNGQQTEYLTSFEWDVQTTSYMPSSATKRKKDQTYTSVLAEGQYHKVKITEDGVYKITKAYLQSNGVNVSEISLSKFKVYGNGGEMLPELIATPRAEDLTENAIYIVDDNGNDKLDDNDFVAWYAKGPTKFSYITSSKSYTATGHDFDVAAYYFLNWEGDAGKRMVMQANGQGVTPSSIISQFDYLVYHEANEENHLKSGRVWWGDKMQITPSKTFTYNVPGMVTGGTGTLQTVTTARSTITSSMGITLNGGPLAQFNYSSVTGTVNDKYASTPNNLNVPFTINSDNLTLSYKYNKIQNDAAAWIDYFILTIPRKLTAYNEQQHIRINSSAVSGALQYNIATLGDNLVWDISNINAPAVQSTFTNGTGAAFTVSGVSASSPPLFILFNVNTTPVPAYIGTVKNQNLHGITAANYIIVTNNLFLKSAERLAEFHRERGLSVVVVDKDQIFNEFSSGSQDVTAIRDFTKLIYDRSTGTSDSLMHLLLFGDASYDYKDIEANNSNLVPIYQSYNSNDHTYSYCSDDYYAILDDDEGNWGTADAKEHLDIGVGRLPAQFAFEADILVDKIIHYHSEVSKGDWINTLTFVADDEDNNNHLEPSETMTSAITLEEPDYNIKKIWLDAYEQVSFGSGNKYPKVNEEITKMVSTKGTLVFNYVGHGGENSMAHERVVTRDEIVAWSNYDKLSFYITASCEIAKIDNLYIKSPGELMLLDADGGAIGLLATTRAVYIGLNTRLNSALVNDNLLKKTNGKTPTLGEAYRKTRNSTQNEGTNARCFILLADPAIRLLNYEQRVTTTAVNGIEINLFNDTLKALSLVTISGEIRDKENNLSSDFNGVIYPTFYDKPSKYKTLGQDPGSLVREFEEQNRVIYKGKVSVIDGKFSFKFVVPKDIAYNVGEGKLSYYAKDGLLDAGGSEYSYKIGGTASNILQDTKFDELNLFVDDESWVFGGTTSFKPTLLATLKDSNGINTIGSGIGREMEAILDAGTEALQSIILNDYFTPDLNSYTEGKIEYPFEKLTPGRHTLKLVVWDVYNNSAEAYTEFVVAEKVDVSVANVLNYPNPFNKNTAFHFDHNKAGQNLSASVTILSVSGKIVKTISVEIPNAPAHSSEIVWDGRDDFGDPIGRGVYLYTLKLRAEDGSATTKTEKLYIIN
jgi:hypothetical protein